MARAWILNLDAEHELEATRRYAPTRRLVAIVEAQRRALFGTLVPVGDLVLLERVGRAGSGAERWSAMVVTGPGEARPTLVERAELDGLEVLAWSPTARARAVVAGSGARLRALPSSLGASASHAGELPAPELLARVNARPFAAELRRPLLDGAFDRRVFSELEPLVEALAAPADLGWLVRRSFGAAGRGRRRLEGATPPTEAELAWLRASLARGPVTLEPWVEITTEFTRSGLVLPGGELVLSGPCFQEVARSGAWTRTESAGAGEVTDGDDRALARALETAGRALAEVGYHGPFGIDAFRYKAGAGRARLNALGELNARFTMDWRPAMEAALARPDVSLDPRSTTR